MQSRFILVSVKSKIYFNFKIFIFIYIFLEVMFILVTFSDVCSHCLFERILPLVKIFRSLSTVGFLYVIFFNS